MECCWPCDASCPLGFKGGWDFWQGHWDWESGVCRPSEGSTGHLGGAANERPYLYVSSYPLPLGAFLCDVMNLFLCDSCAVFPPDPAILASSVFAASSSVEDGHQYFEGPARHSYFCHPCMCMPVPLSPVTTDEEAGASLPAIPPPTLLPPPPPPLVKVESPLDASEASTGLLAPNGHTSRRDGDARRRPSSAFAFMFQ